MFHPSTVASIGPAPAVGPDAVARLKQVRAVVLLAGSVRATRFRAAIGRAVHELPIQDELTLLDAWRDGLMSLAEFTGLRQLPVRVMIDRTVPEPDSADWPAPLNLRFERDPLEFRGTGGLLADLARPYDDHDYLLVADAAQLLCQPLASVAGALAESAADVSLLTQLDAEPAGVMLVRCGAVRGVSSVGFVDLKEQALPTIARSQAVKAVNWPGRVGFPLRTLTEYLDALRALHRSLRDLPVDASCFTEDWSPTFSLVESGAEVAPDAVVHDSVVLAGGRVGPGAVVVRSIVCGRGMVASDRDAIEQIITV